MAAGTEAEPTPPDDEQAFALLDRISEPLDAHIPEQWQGDVIDTEFGRLYWHPSLGYVSLPDDPPSDP
jgi:hypothetical protein